jgi:hypothetical protein
MTKLWKLTRFVPCFTLGFYVHQLSLPCRFLPSQEVKSWQANGNVVHCLYAHS